MMEDVMKMLGDRTLHVLLDVHGERKAQDRKWGEQNHPDFLPSYNQNVRDYDREAKIALCDAAAKVGLVTWEHILKEEVAEMLACGGDPAHLRRELIQVAAVCVAWVEAIDRRAKRGV